MIEYNINEKDYVEIMEKISEEVLHTSYLNLVEQKWTIDGKILDEICRKLVNISTEYNREMSINVLKEELFQEELFQEKQERELLYEELMIQNYDFDYGDVKY